jgi:hypothetical protein
MSTLDVNMTGLSTDEALRLARALVEAEAMKQQARDRAHLLRLGVPVEMVNETLEWRRSDGMGRSPPTSPTSPTGSRSRGRRCTSRGEGHFPAASSPETRGKAHFAKQLHFLIVAVRIRQEC